MRRTAFIPASLSAAMVAAGCSTPQGFDSPDSAARMEAVREAAAAGDKSAIAELITLLGSDDPALRMVSIRTLERLTGQTLGYDHAAPRPEREEAMARWAEWFRASHADSADSAAAPAAKSMASARVRSGGEGGAAP